LWFLQATTHHLGGSPPYASDLGLGASNQNNGFPQWGLVHLQVAANPHNYDTWFDYARLEENAGDADKIREVSRQSLVGRLFQLGQGRVALVCHICILSFLQ